MSFNNEQLEFDFTGEVSFDTSLSSPVTEEGRVVTPPSPSKPILLVGDYMIDEWHVVKSDGRSAEANIPRYRETEYVECPGGAGNVRRNLEALGATVIGPQPTWQQQVPRKVRYVTQGGRQVLRSDKRDYCDPVHINEIVDGCGVIVVSDYMKGAITPNIIDYIKLIADRNNSIIVVDTKACPWVWASNQTIFVPNLAEYTQWAKYYNDMPWVVRKEGKNGATQLYFGDSFAHADTVPSNVRSVCGAGDVVVAALAHYINTGDCVTLAMHKAMEATSKAVESRFTCLVKN